MENPDKTDQLLLKLELLLKRQEEFSLEVKQLKNEILNSVESSKMLKKEEIQKEVEKPSILEANKVTVIKPVLEPVISSPEQKINIPQKNTPNKKSTLENFIGENLINKIGILITIIGVGIGAKYSIDHNLISPTTRILLAYLVAAGLLAFALKLKKNYLNFSAVLLSGSLSIMYFITYMAFSFYAMFPQITAFIIMLSLTVAAVFSAIKYDKQVIAHIGLAGAYAVPFLLSDGSGKIAVFFTYMAIINIGILVLSFKKYWKTLYYVSFGVTWLIYIAWYATTSFITKENSVLALSFLGIFFTIFYVTFLAYKLLRKEKFDIGDIFLILLNSFLFFAHGFTILYRHGEETYILSLFTLGNAILHFVVYLISLKTKEADKNLIQLIGALAIMYLTLSFFVQLEGNWLTLTWMGEALILFGIGRLHAKAIFEKLSYPILLLVFCSLIHDWSSLYFTYDQSSPELRITPILNSNFLSSFICIAAFTFIFILNRNKKHPSAFLANKDLNHFVNFVIASILILVTYFTFAVEIANYWHQKFKDSFVLNDNFGFEYPIWNEDISTYSSIWLLNYSLIFLSVLTFINISRFKNTIFAVINLSFTTLFLFLFTSVGLFKLSQLRESYLKVNLDHDFQISSFNIGIRYLTFLFVALALFSIHKTISKEFMKQKFKIVFDFILHATMLFTLSSELVNLLDLAKSEESYKLGLSILWGVYSLFLIVIGLWKNKIHLRITAMSLFGLTLIKLFLYDISHLHTIAKTIVFLSLGVLLLIISFLYNKFKRKMEQENKSES